MLVDLLIKVACITGIAFCVLLLYAIIMAIIKGIISDVNASKDNEFAQEIVNQILLEAVKDAQQEEDTKKCKSTKK